MKKSVILSTIVAMVLFAGCNAPKDEDKTTKSEQKVEKQLQTSAEDNPAVDDEFMQLLDELFDFDNLTDEANNQESTDEENLTTALCYTPGNYCGDEEQKTQQTEKTADVSTDDDPAIDEELMQILHELFDLDNLMDEEVDNKNADNENMTETICGAPGNPCVQEEQETSDEQVQVVDPDDLDYTLRGSCGSFSDLFGDKSWFYTYGSSADRLVVEITDDSGEVIEKIRPDNRFSYGNNIAELVKNDGENENLLKAHFRENVRISCIYEDSRSHKKQVFHDFAPLDDPKLWEKKLYKYDRNKLILNDTLMYGSILNDLRYKIYLKNYAYYGDKKTALRKADDFMEKAFPGGVYHPASYLKYRNMWNGQSIAPAKSLQAQYYRKVNDLAWQYTDKRVDLLNDLIAENYKSYYLDRMGCSDTWICSSIFPDATQTLIADPEFHDGLLHWETKEELYGSALGSISEQIVSTDPRKYNIKLSLKASHGTGTPLSYLDVHQNYTLQNPQEIDDLTLKIKSQKLYGGTTNPWNLTTSGLAGYFACFNDANDKELGCMIVSDYTDKITLPILIGYMFQMNSSDSLYIVKGSRKPFDASYNLGKIVKEHLPAVRNNLSEVTTVSIGAFVTEATQQKHCIDCTSTVEAEKISLEKLK